MHRHGVAVGDDLLDGELGIVKGLVTGPQVLDMPVEARIELDHTIAICEATPVFHSRVV